MSAEPPAPQTSMAIPKCTKPACVLGYLVADGGKEDEGRGMCKERCLAVWGEGPKPEFTGEINLLWAGSRPPQRTGQQLYSAFPPWAVLGLTL